jgi:hypothetical protein
MGWKHEDHTLPAALVEAVGADLTAPQAEDFSRWNFWGTKSRGDELQN